MKKYMNPGLVRPPNSGLASHAEEQRRALLSMAGVNVPKQPQSSSHKTSPSKSKHSLQHTAHGIHGPAHATSARTQASSIVPAPKHAPNAMDLGKYDGGLEADEAGKEAVTGEAGKLLEMDSGAASG